MKKILYMIYLKSKHLFLSMCQFREIHIGDLVIYNGKKCFVSNGTRYDDKGVHYWDIYECKQNANNTQNKYYATDKEIRRCFCLSNVKNALFHDYQWWKLYWYRIDLQAMLSK